jgi:hypothetical protein
MILILKPKMVNELPYCSLGPVSSPTLVGFFVCGMMGRFGELCEV